MLTQHRYFSNHPTGLLAQACWSKMRVDWSGSSWNSSAPSCSVWPQEGVQFDRQRACSNCKASQNKESKSAPRDISWKKFQVRRSQDSSRDFEKKKQSHLGEQKWKEELEGWRLQTSDPCQEEGAAPRRPTRNLNSRGGPLHFLLKVSLELQFVTIFHLSGMGERKELQIW